MTAMSNVTVVLTSQEWLVLLGAVGAILASMANDVPPGQPAPPEMLEMEALQAKLMLEMEALQAKLMALAPSPRQ